MNKPKPCTLGNRHSWQFRGNVTTTQRSGQTARISKRGIYRCACGARKHGAAQ